MQCTYETAEYGYPFGRSDCKLFFREYINLIDDELEDDDDPLVQEAIATSLQQDQYK